MRRLLGRRCRGESARVERKRGLRIIGRNSSAARRDALAHARPPAIRSRSRSRSAPSPSAGTGSCTSSASCCSSVLGKLRARQNLLTGWHPRDVDDMLFYGVFGVILGGRLGYVLFYKPLYYLAHPLEILSGLAGRHELPRRLPRRADRAVVLRAARATSAGSTSPISSRRWCRSGSPPAGSATSSTASCGAASTDVPWGMVFPQVGPEPRHPSQLYQFAARGPAAVRGAVDLHAAARGRWARCRGSS